MTWWSNVIERGLIPPDEKEYGECEECGKDCMEYDSNGVCIHDLCKVDKDAMQAESRTELGAKLRALRAKAIANGMELLSEDEIGREHDYTRGHTY